VVGADAVAQGLAEGRVPWALLGALVAAIVVLGLLVRHARRMLALREAALPANSTEKSPLDL
jgi:hypothetical protein